MNILAIDTCEARGSLALLGAGSTVAQRLHENAEDYSGWLLPAVDSLLAQARLRMEQVDLLAVATGPGSFTGLRVGLTTVKAWAEVYGKPVVGVSRLEGMSRSFTTEKSLVTASYDAYRGQLFGAVYRSEFGRRERIGDELVIAPSEFVELVNQEATNDPVDWVSLDPEMLASLETWQRRKAIGDSMRLCEPALAAMIGMLGAERAQRGEFTDPLELEANYVRRSDAEIFWKGPASSVR